MQRTHPTHSESGAASAGRVLRSARAWGILLSVTALGLIADLASKWAAFEYLGDSPIRISRAAVLAAASPMDTLPRPIPVWQVIPSVLDFTLVLNPGAVFGMGAGKRVIFIAFTGFALAFALFLFARWTTRRDWLSHAALGLLISGGLGNLYDRLQYACVRDFLHPLPGVRLPFAWEWPWGGREVWPYVSNVADLLLIIGIGALVWRTLKPLREHPEARDGPTAG